MSLKCVLTLLRVQLQCSLFLFSVWPGIFLEHSQDGRRKWGSLGNFKFKSINFSRFMSVCLTRKVQNIPCNILAGLIVSWFMSFLFHADTVPIVVEDGIHFTNWTAKMTKPGHQNFMLKSSSNLFKCFLCPGPNPAKSWCMLLLYCELSFRTVSFKVAQICAFLLYWFAKCISVCPWNQSFALFLPPPKRTYETEGNCNFCSHPNELLFMKDTSLVLGKKASKSTVSVKEAKFRNMLCWFCLGFIHASPHNAIPVQPHRRICPFGLLGKHIFCKI